MQASFEEFESKTFHIAGSRFYYQGGDNPIEVKINSGGDSRSFVLQSGQGINSDDRFSSVQITNSGVDQEVEFEVTDREIFDNRIPGSMTIAPEGGVMPVEQTGVVQVAPDGGVMTVRSAVPSACVMSKINVETFGVPKLILAQNSNRAKALIRFDGAGYIGAEGMGSTSGIKLNNVDGFFVYESAASLWAVGEQGANCNVIEYLW